MSSERLNAYRVMWIMVLFDLPTDTKTERRIASSFRKQMIKDGFQMFQFSIYLRHCASRENAEVHVRRVKKQLPDRGHVGILTITDKQFGAMEIFIGHKPEKPKTGPMQLELF